MAKGNEALDSEEATRRLKALRHFVAGSDAGAQTRFAKQMEIEVKRWNNFERGLPLSKDVAIQLVRKIPGLTLDWLFLGIEDGLPMHLQRKLTTADKEVTLLRAGG